MGSVTLKSDKMTSSQPWSWRNDGIGIRSHLAVLTLFLLSLNTQMTTCLVDMDTLNVVDRSDPAFLINNLSDLGGEEDPSVPLSNEVESSYKGEDWPFMWLRMPMKRKNHGQLRFARPRNGKRFDGHLRFVKQRGRRNPQTIADG